MFDHFPPAALIRHHRKKCADSTEETQKKTLTRKSVTCDLLGTRRTGPDGTVTQSQKKVKEQRVFHVP